MAFQLEILTPESKIFSDIVDELVLPGVDGELGILTSHSNLVTILKPGDLTYKIQNTKHELVIGKGLVEITGTHVRVLVEEAKNLDQLDESAIQEALERAEKLVTDLSATGMRDTEDFAIAMANIQRATAKLEFKRKRKTI
jgi:F-type H+-transporting ATPase subunit epsilon